MEILTAEKIKAFSPKIQKVYKPITGIDLKITDDCNLRCDFCVNKDGGIKNDKVKVSKTAIVKLIYELINAPRALANFNNIYFTGGETSLAIKQIVEILDSLPSGLFTSIATNGTLLNKNKIDFLSEHNLSRIKISYDTTDRYKLPLIRHGATDNDLSIIEKNASYITNSNILLFFRIALGKPNLNELNDIYSRACDLGVDVLQIKPIIEAGRAEENKDKLLSNRRELLDAFAKLSVIYNKEYKTRISVSCFPPAEKYGFVVKKCANHDKLYLSTNGDIHICNYCLNDETYLGNYLNDLGVINSLINRYNRYNTLFDDKIVVNGCVAKNYYE